jgi:GNAT superfamily N-acetyltransferase
VSSFTIRRAVMADMEQLQGVFLRASLSNDNDREPLLAHPQWLVVSDARIQDGRMRAAVDHRDAVVGFASYQITDGVAELEDLFVDPPWMRRGVGAALVLEIAELLRLLDFERLEVTANPHAMAFYQHMEFVFDHMVETEFSEAPRMFRRIA